MNKTWVGRLTVLPCVLISFATFPTPSPAFNGSYIGAELGASLAYANQTTNNSVDLAYFGSQFVSNEPFSLYSSMVRSSAAGSILAGFGRTFNRFYLAGELALSNADYKMNSSSNNGISRSIESMDSNITLSGSENDSATANVSPTQFGAFLRPGIMLTPTSLLYGRVGTSVVKVRYNTQTTALKTLSSNNTTAFQLPITMLARKSVTRAAFQIGTGLEHAINDKLTIRLDYLYSYYGTMTAYASQSTSAESISLTAKGIQTVSLNDQSIMLGMAYHFNV